MCDEEDGHALRAQPAQHGEQLLHRRLVEAGGRLVQDQHPRITGAQRAGDGDHLLQSQRVVGQGLADVDVDIERRQGARRFLAHQAGADQPEAPRVAAGAEVLGHREIGAEIDLLVDRADAELLRLLRGARGDGLAGEQDAAGVRLVEAGQHLDQRGLAGPVLAHQRVHLAGVKAQAHALQRLHAGTEALLDAGQLQQRTGAHFSTCGSAALWRLDRPCKRLLPR
jgi:hypothetical protein